MLQSSIRHFAMKRWFKLTDVKLNDLFKVGTRYSEPKLVTPDLANNRAQLGRYVISTSSVASTLHTLACSVVDDTVPSHCHALTRHTKLNHREPICVGDKMELSLRVQKVDADVITFDVNVVKVREDRIAFDGILEIGVIQTESN
jgi:predicted thioesterase